MASLFTGYDGRRPASTTALRWATLVVALLCAGCRVAVDEQPLEPGTVEVLDGLPIDPEAPYPPAIAAAIGSLAEELGVAPQAIEVVSYEAVEWPDGCLGLPDAGEACTEAITPGWRITLRLAGRTFRFRADALGTELRQEKEPVPSREPGLTAMGVLRLEVAVGILSVRRTSRKFSRRPEWAP